MEPEQQAVICEALDNMHLLTGWEADFVNGLAEYPDARPLTEPETIKLDEIANKLR